MAAWNGQVAPVQVSERCPPTEKPGEFASVLDQTTVSQSQITRLLCFFAVGWNEGKLNINAVVHQVFFFSVSASMFCQEAKHLGRERSRWDSPPAVLLPWGLCASY